MPDKPQIEQNLKVAQGIYNTMMNKNPNAQFVLNIVNINNAQSEDDHRSVVSQFIPDRSFKAIFNSLPGNKIQALQDYAINYALEECGMSRAKASELLNIPINSLGQMIRGMNERKERLQIKDVE